VSRSASRVSNRREPPPPARTVKPNRRTYKSLPIVAICSGQTLSESGEAGTVAELINALPDYGATLFSCVGSADFVTMLNQTYLLRYPGTWQRVVTPHEAGVTRVGSVERASRMTVVVNYFGWQHKSKKGGGTYHRIIDPVTMYQQGMDEIWPTFEGEPIRKLLKWAVTIRDFCAENNLQVRPTLGGISSQMLRSPRFYPNARRKVPSKINERARENLPGNHYFLNVTPDPSNNFSAYYLDQKRAHHYHARNVALPDSNNCFAYGAFTDLGSVTFAIPDTRFMGLYCLDLDPPSKRPVYNWIGDRLDAVFVYSNELQHLLDSGYRVRGVRAAWGSVKRDYGLQQYAEWAETQLDEYDDPIWLKLLLHATYGCLAVRPMNRKAIYRLAKSGTPVEIRTGRHKLGGLLVESTRKLEPGIAHVIQRGMIESATRSESIGLAQWLDSKQHKTLCIYADAIIVEADDDNPLPDIPDPWRCKTQLTNLQFVSAQAFLSNEMTKLPGVGRELRAYRPTRGYAPHKQVYDVVAGKLTTTSRRI
jgi:hypothetical protein